jgi:soluble lytic murein transglycosylase-like protein
VQATRRKLIIGGGLATLGVPACAVAAGRAPTLAIPTGYVVVGREQHVPPAVLFGVALQESSMMFGERGAKRSLPWPWTLNVAGAPGRFATREQAHAALVAAIGRGIDSVDIGAMQVNWRYHRARLIGHSQALDPYWNLRVGASILRDHFRDSADWFVSAGRYHSPGNPARATQYASGVFSRLARLGHA